MSSTQLSTLFLIFFIFSRCAPKEERAKIIYPVSNKADIVDTYFEKKVEDPYRWLENDTSTQTAEWIEAQNAITFAYLNSIPYREELKQRIQELVNYERFSSPSKQGDWYYYFRNDGLQNQSVLYRQKDLSSEGEVFLDPNTFSDDGTVALGQTSFSGDGKLFAYSVSVSGSDWREIFVMDTETRKKLDDKIEWAKFTSINWFKDGFFYAKFPKPKEGEKLSGVNRFGKIYYHKIGTPQEQDRLVIENPEDGDEFYGASITEDEKFLVISSSHGTSGNTLAFIDLHNDAWKVVKIIDNEDHDHRLIGSDGEDFFVVTNLNAPNNRLVRIKTSHPAPEHWEDIIPEAENVLSASTAGNKIFANYTVDARSRVFQYSYAGEQEKEIELPGIGSAFGFEGLKEDENIFYSFTSFTYPTSIFQYSIATGESTLFKGSEVSFEVNDFTTSQVFYESKDGTRVPMFIVHRKDVELDGNHPTLLYGYGGFNVSLTPSYSSRWAVWLDMGGIFALANIRGGGEYGKNWHKAGTKTQKQNVFDDFIAAAEYLIDQKYTSSQYLAIKGGSNGGLLVGACMTQRPDLYRVALPAVGVMDMLRYHRFTIGRAWAVDFGTSEDSKEMFDYLLGYSPYHNLKPNTAYPATLVTTADHDDRVVPAHSFKFSARLQEYHEGNSPVMIRIESKAGHGAGKPTDKYIEELADEYAFTWYNMDRMPDPVKQSL